MAIKIINRGIPPEEKVYVVTCNTCESKISFLKNDTSVERKPFLGALCPSIGFDNLFIDCPVCKSKIYFYL